MKDTPKEFAEINEIKGNARAIVMKQRQNLKIREQMCLALFGTLRYSEQQMKEKLKALEDQLNTEEQQNAELLLLLHQLLQKYIESPSVELKQTA